MKFYNDFSSMFNAQSGLKSDLSVFNELEGNGNGGWVVTDERGVERTIIYGQDAPTSWFDGLTAYRLIDFCSSHYDLYSMPDIWELIKNACGDDMRFYDDGYTIYGSRPFDYLEASQVANRINEKVVNYL